MFICMEVMPIPAETNPYDIDPVHGVDRAVVAEYASAMDAGWPAGMPPVLVVERDGRYSTLDGHHRVVAAYMAELPLVPALVISADDYSALIDAEFHGYEPTRSSDLDDYIRLTDGRLYSDVRWMG